MGPFIGDILARYIIYKKVPYITYEGMYKIPMYNRDLYIAKNQKLCQSQNSKWKNFAKAEYWHSF